MSCRLASLSTVGDILEVDLVGDVDRPPVFSSEMRTVSSRDRAEDDPVERRSTTPVVVVGDEHELDVLGPALELEGTGADRRAGCNRRLSFSSAVGLTMPAAKTARLPGSRVDRTLES